MTKPDEVGTRGGKRPGAGRKKLEGGGAVPISGSVRKDLADEFDQVREQKGMSRSEALTDAIQRFVKAYQRAARSSSK